MRKHFKIFLRGLIITAPIIITVYVCVAFALWLERTTSAGLQRIHANAPPGLGVVIALAVIYFAGLFSRTWIVRGVISLGEAALESIPGIKSLHSAVKNLLQFLSGADEKTRGVPARLRLMEGKVDMLGLVTQKQPETFMGEHARGRVAVYLPMSYQIGGFTVFVKPEDVEEIAGMTVEGMLKLSMTAGLGSTGEAKDEAGGENDILNQRE